MKKYIYECIECKKMATKETYPPLEGCKNDSFHRWRKLGAEGSQRYRCKKCGCTVNLEEYPIAMPCSKYSNHDWEENNI
jgi:transposase-like protein